jgi:hypothetical protein
VGWFRKIFDFLHTPGGIPGAGGFAVYALGGFSDTGDLLEPELCRLIPDV